MSISSSEANQLIEMLKDRLEECCDCIEAGYEITRSARYTTIDAELTVEGGRSFIDEASRYLKEQERESCNTPQ
ncbi:hypothetical protein ACRTEU_00675 [Vibrio alginolyticus]|uniref:hypothetical protein n=1 Tax=Vibrio alginolyticus TaxID=663 RepID=UPI00215BE818|nr:hypothetical protein [Vibrio alginolyticus]MCR9313664.1 hypothetical protein [Vibrio alginolyticus]MCR9319465.1 hypothetical protein [Vibrio alginolyticus]MCR9403579.1 hypothetical protein [Vibrio alginolyticus]MCR9467397.1 hypothetical protein [Vibrio alginolyticus]MCR9479746.1 hypothetical protein [Vibrio alginolyticus]